MNFVDMNKKEALLMETIDKIKMLLKEKGLDQKDLTSYLGITKSVFSAWKKGTSTSYTKYYNEIADFFGVPVSTIVDDETAMEIDQILSAFL
jgi:transcriptional regulator with XRE-family HTH domain